ncbi:MAG: hypothetical protein JWL76_1041 [Thermoleophilia bacterium]|nr:hypothetical protein [Thermoleophilia bacterium]
MEISKTRAAAYVGAGAAVGGGFAALRAGGSVTAIGLGVATGIVASGVQTAVEAKTGSSELGWGASITGGAVAGAFLLKGLAPAGLSPIAARGVGAAIGAAAGLLAPVAAGIVLAQLSRD